MNTQTAINRSRLYSNIRNYFTERNYIELETPVLSPSLIPEPTIDCFATQFISEFLPSRELYLIPSPEIYMKQFISKEKKSVFEISKCFRNCEQIGSCHNIEFSMLEYYTVNFNEKDSIALTQDMIRKTALPGCPQSVTADFEIISMRDLVKKYANGTDIEELQNTANLRKQAQNLGLEIPAKESWDDTFNRIFLTFVEPSLPKDRPVLITDYPKQINCLAKEEGPYRRRWELYINGLEIANCYYEEDNKEKVAAYYEEEYQKLIYERSLNKRPIPDADPSFASFFEDFPKCSGVAVGLDRLLMVQTGAKSINDVLLFPFIL